MKRASILLLLVCILGQTFIRTIWTVHYQWNMSIYEQYCENRDKPEMRCNGKCYLEKKIEGSDHNSPAKPQLPEGFHLMKDLQCDLPVSGMLQDYLIPVPTTPFPAFPEQWIQDILLAGIFRPPAARESLS